MDDITVGLFCCVVDALMVDDSVVLLSCCMLSVLVLLVRPVRVVEADAVLLVVTVGVIVFCLIIIVAWFVTANDGLLLLDVIIELLFLTDDEWDFCLQGAIRS